MRVIIIGENELKEVLEDAVKNALAYKGYYDEEYWKIFRENRLLHEEIDKLQAKISSQKGQMTKMKNKLFKEIMRKIEKD